jgi:hypothetical protein
MTLSTVSGPETTRLDTVTDAADWIAGFAWLQAYIVLHPRIRLPKRGTLRIEVQGETRAEREQDLREIAAQWEASCDDRGGSLVMERWFGKFVCIRAQVTVHHATHQETLDALRSAQVTAA